MKAFISTVALSATLLGASIAQAGVGATLKIGTLGAGADVTVGLVETVNLRLGASGLSYGFDINRDKDKEGVGKITPTLKLMTFGALLDWHPGGGGFRLSAGCFLNQNKLDLTADTSQKVEINDRVYQLGDLNGSVDFRRFAPYVGLGYGNAAGADGRWHFAFDLGAMYQGAPQVALSASVNDPVLQTQLDADLKEEARKIEDDIGIFKVYPVLSLGVSFRF